MSTVKEWLSERQEQMATLLAAEDQKRSEVTGTPRRISEDDRRHLQKSNAILLDETAPVGDDLRGLVGMAKSSEEGAPKFLRPLAEFSDHCVIMKPLLKKMGYADIRETRYYRSESQRLRKMMEKEGAHEMAKVMVTGTSGAGSEWVPTGFSADLWQYIDSKGKVYPLFRKTVMPYNPFRPPYTSAQLSIFNAAQASENYPETTTSSIPTTRPTTGNFTLTAKKLGAMVEFTDEFNEDSVVPVLPTIREDIGVQFARERDNAIINGDTAADHQDADVSTTTDVRTAFDGLRKYGLARTTTSLATFNIANLRAIQSVMGRYAENEEDLFWLVGLKTRQQIKSLVVNIYNAPNYVAGVGQAGQDNLRIDGFPVYGTSRMREDLNASGVNDLTTQNRATVLLVNKMAWTVGIRHEMELELFRDPRVGKYYLIGWERKAFGTPYTAATDYACAIGINVTP